MRTPHLPIYRNRYPATRGFIGFTSSELAQVLKRLESLKGVYERYTSPETPELRSLSPNEHYVSFIREVMDTAFLESGDETEAVFCTVRELKEADKHDSPIQRALVAIQRGAMDEHLVSDIEGDVEMFGIGFGFDQGNFLGTGSRNKIVLATYQDLVTNAPSTTVAKAYAKIIGAAVLFNLEPYQRTLLPYGREVLAKILGKEAADQVLIKIVQSAESLIEDTPLALPGITNDAVFHGVLARFAPLFVKTESPMIRHHHLLTSSFK